MANVRIQSHSDGLEGHLSVGVWEGAGKRKI